MNLLAIDTSTELATVALSWQGQIESEQQENLRQHAQFLLPMVERLLARAELKLAQLDGIVFGQGPGSFTGLRITCSVAKALAYAHDLPMFPVSSLSAIAFAAYQIMPALSSDVQVLVMLDARMRQVYWACFTQAFDNLTGQVTDAAEVHPPMVPLVVAGAGYESYIDQLPAQVRANITQKIAVFPHAKTMIQLVEHGKIQPVSAENALPVYVRNDVVQGEKRG